MKIKNKVDINNIAKYWIANTKKFIKKNTFSGVNSISLALPHTNKPTFKLLSGFKFLSAHSNSSYFLFFVMNVISLSKISDSDIIFNKVLFLTLSCYIVFFFFHK